MFISNISLSYTKQMDNIKKKIKVNMEMRLRCSICAIFYVSPHQMIKRMRKMEKEMENHCDALLIICTAADLQLCFHLQLCFSHNKNSMCTA